MLLLVQAWPQPAAIEIDWLKKFILAINPRSINHFCEKINYSEAFTIIR
jgi:hypothetical protein